MIDGLDTTDEYEDTIRLHQDNHDNLYVDIPKDEIESTIKNVTNWRTPTKHYSSFLNRFDALGSSTRDKYIAKLYRQGY